MTPGQDNDPKSGDNIPGGGAPVIDPTLKEYLETASEASRRTRFITILMVVASVLVFVSVLNSSDYGWISLRLDALRHNTSPYTIRKFPLLCRCDAQVMAEKADLCREVEQGASARDLLWTIDAIGRDLQRLEGELSESKAELEKLQTERGTVGENEFRERLSVKEREVSSRQEALISKQAQKEKICGVDRESLANLSYVMNRSAAETKYTVRVPFFGVAFDINDVGFFGGFGLWIVLIMLRLGLRSQIVSLRIGFKKAFAAKRGQDFYDILAARQVFVFPPLEDRKQKVSVARGWIERWWMKSALGKAYHWLRSWAQRRLERIKGKFLAFAKIEEEKNHPLDAQQAGDGVETDVWRVNRNVSLRIVPKGLCLLPFFIYAAQCSFDYRTRRYGYELSEGRTLLLLTVEALFLINIFVFGVWCITKWNELDRLWDYYNRIKDKNGEPETNESKAAEHTGSPQP